MRILVWSLLALSVTACRGQKNISPDSPALSNPDGQGSSLVLQSVDGGNTWQDISQRLPDSLQISSIFAKNGEVFLGCANGSLYHSRQPRTDTWERQQLGDASQNGIITGIFEGRTEPYIAIYMGGFLKKMPNQNTWESVPQSVAIKQVQAVAEMPNGHLFVGCPSGIFKSIDAGKSWQQVFADGWISSLSMAGNTIVASSAQGLLRGTNDGENWENVLPDDGGVYRTTVIGNRFSAIRVAGGWGKTEEGVPQRAFTSADGGKTWQRIAEGKTTVHAIYDLRQVGQYLFCSHKGGISRSTDGGTTWELVHAPTNQPQNWGLAHPNGSSSHFELITAGQIIFAVRMRMGC